MSTDSTPSTKSLKDKRLKEYSDEDLWTLLESKERKVQKLPDNPNPCVNVTETAPWFSYHLTNGVFYFILKGGNDKDSDPSNLDLPLKDYKWFRVELWDYREMTQEMVAAEGPTELKYSFPGFPEFVIQMVTHVWPHQPIYPQSDERFKEQSWAKEFRPGQMAYEALVSPAVFAEIVRYCDKISGMKAFW